MTRERREQLREHAKRLEAGGMRGGCDLLTECLDYIDKLEHDKVAATKAANRAIKKLAKSK